MEKIEIVRFSIGSQEYEINIPENATLVDLQALADRFGVPLPQNIIDRKINEEESVIDFSNLPDWMKTWTADQVSQYVHDNVLNGFERADVDTYIANLPNTVVGIKTGLIQIGYALVDIRSILEIVAKLLIYLRDLTIKYRNE